MDMEEKKTKKATSWWEEEGVFIDLIPHLPTEKECEKFLQNFSIVSGAVDNAI